MVDDQRDRRVCLITSAHISYNPRLVKEADALFDAGYSVSVVSPVLEEKKRVLDESIVESRGWEWVLVDARYIGIKARTRRVWFSLVQKTLLRMSTYVRSAWVEDRAYSRFYRPLVSRAVRQHADMYIAHNLPALPVAARAASVTDALLGFDAEDFHRGEFPKLIRDGGNTLYELTEAIEARYIPLASHLTAASPGIGDAYRRVVPGVDLVSVLNVFPLSDREVKISDPELAAERRGSGLSLYWYSQVIGPDRGLEDVLAALSVLDGVHLSIRGVWASDYETIFRQELSLLNLEDRVHVLDSAPPGELVARAAAHDIGLALERPDETENRNICVTNKILVYLLAGIAVAATDTVGQRGVIKGAGDVGFLFASGDVEALTNGIRSLRDDADKLARAKLQSRKVAEHKYCWEKEKELLITAVGQALAGKC